MDHDLYRAALAIACVFAVVLGASLFPASGFGTNPVPAGGIANGSGPGSGGGGPGDAGTATVAETTSGESATTSSTPDDTTSADGSTTTTATDGSDGSDASTDTTTTTTTATPASGAAADGGLQGSLLALATIVFGAGATVVLASVGLGRHHRRRHPDEWDLPSAPHLRVVEYLRRIPQTSLSFVMFAGANAPGILDGLADGIGSATSGLGAMTAGIGTLAASLGRGLATVPGGVLRGIGSLGRGLGSITLGFGALSSIGSGSFLGRSDDRPDDDPRSGASATPDANPDPEPPEPPASVREAFERLQEDLGVSGDDGETPGEIARRAIDRGLPTDAIRSLTTAFRDVRYGGRPDDGERVTVARDAYERVRRALEGESS
ncbi:DUF4129 domain-containing protein [Halorubellus sp. PRR65]|uniref:DUF4129 domain-containing protein n=1 Tax=Halorubellus sp. PRR65 TaxID=3098148 RepID=UPI002B26016B|nr:DUF4129 domain-containing protein [Halorubellus sp. PRR65]